MDGCSGGGTLLYIRDVTRELYHGRWMLQLVQVWSLDDSRYRNSSR
jgi:hypothetical protein